MAEKVFTSCTNSGPVSVYVKDGKITRVRPLVVDENDYKPWVIEAGGKKYSPRRKSLFHPTCMLSDVASTPTNASSIR